MGWYYCIQDCTDIENKYRDEGQSYNIGYDPKTPYLVKIEPPAPAENDMLREVVETQAKQINELKNMVLGMKESKEPKEPKEPASKSLSKMNKDELTAVAEAKGLEVPDESTNAQIVEMIKASEE